MTVAAWYLVEIKERAYRRSTLSHRSPAVSPFSFSWPRPRRHTGHRRGELALLLGVLIAAGLLVAPATAVSPPVVMAPADSAVGRPACRLTAKLVPTCPGVLTGAFVLPRSGESFTDAVRRHEAETQTQMSIVHNYYRGSRLFPSAEEKKLLRVDGGRRLLLANWKPDDGFSWRQVADGAADGMIRAQADYLRTTYHRKMFIGVHHEPENEVDPTAGSGFEARDYRAMYRRVVNIFRAEGATKVVWVMNYMGAQKWALEPWYDDLYPGSRYVDWLAFDPYKTPSLGGTEGGFNTLVNEHDGDTAWRGAYRWAKQNHPHKPVMLAEWGIGERPGDLGYKARFFAQIPQKLHRWPNLRALVYFDSYDADVAGDVSVNTSPQSLEAFRGFVNSPASLRLLLPKP